MLSTKDICAILMAGGAALAPAPKAVERPAEKRVERSQPAKKVVRQAPKPKPSYVAPVAAKPCIMEMPTRAPDFDFQAVELLSLQDKPFPPVAFLLGVPPLMPIASGGGGGTNPNVPGIPEPKAWLMMIAGFGLVGAAMRRESKAA